MIGDSALATMMATDKRDGAATREEELDAPPLRAINFDLDPIPIGLAGAAQQGLIKSFVRRQPMPGRLHILAKWANGTERHDAMRALRDHLVPFLSDSFRPHYVIYVCVRMHYGQRHIKLNDLAPRVLYLVPRKAGQTHANWLRSAELACRELRMGVAGMLSDIGGRAEDDATVQLKARGVIA